ncbi:hypothetical protein Cgig2_002602 [Carnegiea gigantea]|uniref:RCHY1 zinc-ribbon domain-containing protein n=1 Tax=Carnegiea gigantea TaxID=171969 RepID=A0A9Q1QB30_9CARY|nr:hypothetical protein Cgig2_002602 [Carnegiea gigantea]
MAIELKALICKQIWQVLVLCNDCSSTSRVKFHIFGHKCSNCNSYNTRVTQKLDSKPQSSSDDCLCLGIIKNSRISPCLLVVFFLTCSHPEVVMGFVFDGPLFEMVSFQFHCVSVFWEIILLVVQRHLHKIGLDHASILLMLSARRSEFDVALQA